MRRPRFAVDAVPDGCSNHVIDHRPPSPRLLLRPPVLLALARAGRGVQPRRVERRRGVRRTPGRFGYAERLAPALASGATLKRRVTAKRDLVILRDARAVGRSPAGGLRVVARVCGAGDDEFPLGRFGPGRGGGAPSGRRRRDRAGEAGGEVRRAVSPRRGQVLARLRELRRQRLAHDAPPSTSSSARARARSTRARVVLVVGGVEGFRGGFRLRAELPRRPSPRRFRVVVPGLHLRLPHFPRVLVSAIEQRRVRRVVSRPRSPPTHRRLGPLLPEDARHGRGLGR